MKRRQSCVWRNFSSLARIEKGKNMEKKKKIVVACNAGVATSATVAHKVKKMLMDRGYDADVEAVDINGLEAALSHADMYVCIMKPDREYHVPMCNGIAFLTGMGIEQELQKIIDVIGR